MNQTLLAGLRLGIVLSSSSVIRSKCRYLADLFAQSVSTYTLNRKMLEAAFRHLNRLNAHYDLALHLIRLLFDGTGGFVHGNRQDERIPGFLFNMNKLFEDVLGKFLKEHLPQKKYHVATQKRFPAYLLEKKEKLKTLAIRPDFIVSERRENDTQPWGKRHVLDAKYIDIDKKGPSTNLLYQLSVYALTCSGDKERNATILYPFIPPCEKNECAESQVINLIRHHRNGEQKKYCSVILQPVDLPKLADLLSQEDNYSEREAFALNLIEAPPSVHEQIPRK